MNGVGKEGGSSLIECLRLNSTLTILDIGANRIPDDIAPVIARVLPSNKALHTLKVRWESLWLQWKVLPFIDTNLHLPTVQLDDIQVGKVVHTTDNWELHIVQSDKYWYTWKQIIPTFVSLLQLWILSKSVHWTYNGFSFTFTHDSLFNFPAFLQSDYLWGSHDTSETLVIQN